MVKLIRKSSVGVCLFVCVASFGQDPEREPWTPGRVAAPTIAIDEAIRLTLDGAPELALEQAGIDLQRGVLRQEMGLFDPRMFGSVDYSYEKSELGVGAIRGQEGARDTIRETLDGFFADLDRATSLLEELRRTDPNNPQIDLEDEEARRLQAQLEFLNALIARSSGQARDDLVGVRNALISGNITELEAAIERLETDIATESERLRKLGVVAEIEERMEGAISLNLQKKLRTGPTAGGFLTYSGIGFTFVGKRQKASEFGGPGLRDRYVAEAGLTLDLPLGRFGGYTSTTAGERAAASDLRALEITSEFTASISALSTAIAYWNLVLAQERLEALESSRALQLRLADLTTALVEGDELPRSEMTRVRATTGGADVFVSSAARSVSTARVSLARTMGLRVESIGDAPLASTSFPQLPERIELDGSDFDEAIRSADFNRADLEAADRFVESQAIRLESARLDLRSLFNANLRTWYSAIGEAWSIASGWQEAVDKWTGPSVSLSVTAERPLRNDTWKGLLEQQQARYDRQVITAKDQRRLARADVVTILMELEAAQDQVRQAERLVEVYGDLVELEIERFRLGTSTLIDTLLTEQRLTDVNLDLVARRYDYAILLTRLRFVTGTLVERDDDRWVVSESSLRTVPEMIR